MDTKGGQTILETMKAWSAKFLLYHLWCLKNGLLIHSEVNYSIIKIYLPFVFIPQLHFFSPWFSSIQTSSIVLIWTLWYVKTWVSQMKILMRTTMDIRYTFFSYLNNGKHMLIQLLKKKKICQQLLTSSIPLCDESLKPPQS